MAFSQNLNESVIQDNYNNDIGFLDTDTVAMDHQIRDTFRHRRLLLDDGCVVVAGVPDGYMVSRKGMHVVGQSQLLALSPKGNPFLW